MTSPIQNGSTLVPVTALTATSDLILAGSGPELKFYRDNDPAEELGSLRIFDSQTLHDIIVAECRHGVLPVLICGGPYVRSLRLRANSDAASSKFSSDDVELSNILCIDDWILSAAFDPSVSVSGDASEEGFPSAVMITAHNALVSVQYSAEHCNQTSPHEYKEKVVAAFCKFKIKTCKLTSGSRTILYSAFLLWPTAARTIAACGTAFGEVLVWTYDWASTGGSAVIYHVFQAHEGSVFGVHISELTKLTPGAPSVRLLASCSDDRTIRLWDIGNLDGKGRGSTVSSDINSSTVQQTGFQKPKEGLSGDTESLRHMATTMGHESRIWNVRVVTRANVSATSSTIARVVSCGEDATCQLWDLVTAGDRDAGHLRSKYVLKSRGTLITHSGKNIWSSSLNKALDGGQAKLLTGGADGAILSAIMPPLEPAGAFHDMFPVEASWSLGAVYTDVGIDILDWTRDRRDYFRSYAFLDRDELLATTHDGALLLSKLMPNGSRKWVCLAVVADLKGYSTLTGILGSSIAFVAGERGHVYEIDAAAGTVTRLTVFGQKVTSIFALDVNNGSKNSRREKPGAEYFRLLLTFVKDQSPCVMVTQQQHSSEKRKAQTFPLSCDEIDMNGLVITSASMINEFHGKYLFLGTRNGTVFVFELPSGEDSFQGKSKLLSAIEQAHGQDSVTGLYWIPGNSGQELDGYLFSVGRDGTLAVHTITVPKSKCALHRLVHKLVLPFAPNIEGLLIDEAIDEVLVYGIRGSRFILYSVNAMCEIMNVPCGGAHRNWAFSPYRYGTHGGIQGGSFAWSKGGTANIFSVKAPVSRAIRSGGPGRDIKACAIAERPLSGSAAGPLIAVGAEDTNISLFRYDTSNKREAFRCVAVLRKHLTGVQSLRWSRDGSCLFSSGGFEEFFVWRVCSVPCLCVGLVLESACPVAIAGSEQRIMDFAVTEISQQAERGEEATFMISMVYSNSTGKFWRYQSNGCKGTWMILGQMSYTASCLTQVAHLTVDKVPYLLTASTDGCVVLWTQSPSEISTSNGQRELQVLRIVRLHQNAIKSLSVVSVGKEGMLIATGGDDGGLGLTLIQTPRSNDSLISFASFLVPQAHAASLTACIALVDQSYQSLHENSSLTARIITASNDQKAKAWRVSVDIDSHDSNCWSISIVGSCAIAVADVSKSAVARIEGKLRVLVVGVGMELLDASGFS